MKIYSTAAWESVKESSFGKPLGSLSALLAEASTTGSADDCVKELEAWVAAMRKGKEFVKAFRDFGKARHKPERLPQVGVPLMPFRKFLRDTLHLELFPTMELLFYKIGFQEKMDDPKEGLMTTEALKHIVSLSFVDLVVRIETSAGDDPLKISIEAWLRSLLLRSFGLCICALGEGDDVDTSVRRLLQDAEGVLQQIGELGTKVDDDFLQLTQDLTHYSTLLRGVVDASSVNTKDTDAALQALELVRLSSIKHDLYQSV
eukprot:12318139-Heterocapsa_arctica.AAC.1